MEENVNHYLTHLGTSFDFFFGYIAPEGEGEEGGWYFWDILHSFRQLGLYPKSKPAISSPEVQEHYIEVPGRNGLLDYTETLTDDVRYYNREGVFEFVQTGGRKKWDATYHKLKNELHGKCKRIIIDEEPDGYYYGRLTVETPKYDDKRGLATFTIKANLEPYKRSIWRSNEPWLWDSLNFETGWIPQYAEVPLLLGGDGHDAFISYNGYDPELPDLEHYANTMPITPNIVIKPVDGDPALPSTARVRMTYPSVEMVYPIDPNTFDHGKTTDGWNTCILKPGDNIEPAPDFIIRDKPGFVGFEIVKDGDTYTANKVAIEMDYRAGWL